MTENPLPYVVTEKANPLDRFWRAIQEEPWVVNDLRTIKDYNIGLFKHSVRVGLVSAELASHGRAPIDELVTIARAGLLHDLGKTALPKKIILKAGPLSDSEKEEIKQHPRIGFNMVSSNDIQVARIILGHHKHQPNGYPKELENEAENPTIERMQRIVAIADHADSLLNEREYKNPWNPPVVIIELEKIFGDLGLAELTVASCLRFAA